MERTLDLGERHGTRVLLSVLAAWGALVVTAAATGLYRALGLAVGPLIVLGMVVPALVYASARGVRDYIAALGVRRLTLFHVWRIAAGLLFFWYGARGLLPERFVRNAATGDLLVGLFAAALFVLPARRGLYLAFHVAGLADLLLAVGTGLTLTLRHDARMQAIQTLPLALIPLYGVGIAGASHLMALDLLRRRR